MSTHSVPASSPASSRTPQQHTINFGGCSELSKQ
jgi:hypothetical protein